MDRFDPNQIILFGSQARGTAAAGSDVARAQEIEAEVDRLAAQLWGLTDAELKEIQESLAELG